jgi:hypothetical protein
MTFHVLSKLRSQDLAILFATAQEAEKSAGKRRIQQKDAAAFSLRSLTKGVQR